MEALRCSRARIFHGGGESEHRTAAVDHNGLSLAVDKSKGDQQEQEERKEDGRFGF